jgi:5-methylcytosine-specific restriction endonuclease McrA
MIKPFRKLTSKDKEVLRQALLQDGHELKCYYCGCAENEAAFRKIWGKKFYGRTARGKHLEIDHLIPKIADVDLENPDTKNLVFACAVCNMAKSNIFYPEEFKKIGTVIREIWEERKLTGRKPIQDL